MWPNPMVGGTRNGPKDMNLLHTLFVLSFFLLFIHLLPKLKWQVATAVLSVAAKAKAKEKKKAAAASTAGASGGGQEAMDTVCY